MTDAPIPDLRPLHAAMVLILACVVLAGSMFLSAQTAPPIEASEPRSAHPPMSWPEPPPVAGGRDAWSTDWPSQRELRAQAYIAAVHHSTTTTTAPAPPTTVMPYMPEPAPPADNPTIPTVPVGDLETLICSYGWDCATALRVARCESTMNPGAVGGAGERGLFQIHPVHAPALGDRWGQLFDPAVNVQVAFEMWSTQGWGPWTCAR